MLWNIDGLITQRFGRACVRQAADAPGSASLLIVLLPLTHPGFLKGVAYVYAYVYVGLYSISLVYT